jgi:outer membrane immunogenic protein
MNRLTLLAAAAIAVGAAAPALAADLPARGPATYTKAPAIVQAAYDWSGFYVGINGGGATSNIDWNADGFGDEGNHHATGGTVGGQFGYRWQMSSWVFGLEAQGNWADFKGNNVSLIPAFAPNVNQTKIDAFGLFTGQIGYAWDRALFYVKGGAAVTDNRYQIFASPTGGLTNSVSESRWGAALGVGIEYAFAPGWSLGFEYDHLFMGNNDIVQGFGFANDHIKEDVDLFTARVNYKFGGPVVARY